MSSQKSNSKIPSLLCRFSSRGRTLDGEPNAVDQHVGRRIRARRTLLEISQETLAAKMGLTFQQIQKYERGANRVTASRLWDLSKILSVPVEFFFEDMTPETAAQSPRKLNAKSNCSDLVPLTSDPLCKTETLELVKAYYRLRNRRMAQDIFNLTLKMAQSVGVENPKDIEQR